MPIELHILAPPIRSTVSPLARRVPEMKEYALPPAQVAAPATLRNDTALYLAMLQGVGPLAG